MIVGSNAYKMGLKKIHFDDPNLDAKYTGWNSHAQSKPEQMIGLLVDGPVPKQWLLVAVEAAVMRVAALWLWRSS